MGFSGKGGRSLKPQSFAPTSISSCASIWQTLGQNTQTHTAQRECSQPYLEPQLSFFFRYRTLGQQFRGGGVYLLLFLWVSKGRLALPSEEGLLPPRNVPLPLCWPAAERTMVLDCFLPSPHSTSPRWRPQAECDLGAEFRQRNVCASLHPRGGLSRPHSQGQFPTFPERPPLAPSENGQKETFTGSPPAPPPPPPPSPPCPLPTPPPPQLGVGGRGRGGGPLARRPLGLALLPGGGVGGEGEARGAPASCQPPGPRLSAVARCLLSGRWPRLAGIWNSARERGPGGGGEEGRRPAARSGIRGPERRRGAERSRASAAWEALRCARPQCISVAVRHPRDAQRGALCTG